MLFFIIVCIPLIAVHILALNVAIVHIHFHFICRVAAVIDIIAGDSSEFTLSYLELSVLSMRRYVSYFGDSHGPLCCRTTAVSR